MMKSSFSRIAVLVVATVLFISPAVLAEWTSNVPPEENKMVTGFAMPGDCWASAWFEQKDINETLGRQSVLIAADNFGVDAHGQSVCRNPGTGVFLETDVQIDWRWPLAAEAHECEDDEAEGSWKLSFMINATVIGQGQLIYELATFTGTYLVKCAGPYIDVWHEGSSHPISYQGSLKSAGDDEQLTVQKPTFSVQETKPALSWDTTLPHGTGDAPPHFVTTWFLRGQANWDAENQACLLDEHSLHHVIAELVGHYDVYFLQPEWDPI